MQQLVAWGRATSECWGPVRVGKQFLESCVVRGKVPGSLARLQSRHGMARLPQHKDRRPKRVLPHFVRVWEYIVTGFGDVGL